MINQFKWTDEQRGVGSLILLAFGFGLIAITARYLSYYYTLFQQLYLTVGAGFVLSLVIFPKTLTWEKIKQVAGKDWLVLLFRVVVGYLIAGSLYRQSLTLTKISNVTFIQSIPFAGLFGFFLFREKFTLPKLILLGVAYLGVVLIAVKDFSSLNSFGKGELFSLISSALFSLSYVSRKWLSNKLNDREIAQILLFLGTVVLVIASITKGESWPSWNWNGLLLISLFLTGLFNAINIFLINYGFGKVKAVPAGNLLMLESVFALVLAIIFYQEIPTLRELVGGLIITASVVGMSRVNKS